MISGRTRAQAKMESAELSDHQVIERATARHVPGTYAPAELMSDRGPVALEFQSPVETAVV